MPHAALLVVQDFDDSCVRVKVEGFNAARGFVGGARENDAIIRDYVMMFQCRTRLCWWCKGSANTIVHFNPWVSMPHAALLVVQDRNMLLSSQVHHVSMPHAALLVVQDMHSIGNTGIGKFQCRTRLCWWCKEYTISTS